MKNRRRTLIVTLLLGFAACLTAQDYSERPWSAHWIAHPTAPATGFAVVHFRRDFTLEELPAQLPVLVSADNRYQLFVNGERVGEGPARGDLLHWRYETYDLRPYLREGGNVIAALVWNYGIDKAWSQQSYRTAFVLQPTDPAQRYLETDATWRSYHNPAYSPITGSRDRLGTYVVTGPQIRIDGTRAPWGWEQPDYDPTGWPAAVPITKAAPAGVGTEFYWALVPRSIPLFPRRPLPSPSPLSVRQGNRSLTRDTLSLSFIPPHREWSVLLRFPRLVNFFPTYRFRGGKGARVRVSYAESLVDDRGNKGDRAAYRGKKMLGVYDEFLLDGRSRSYTTPWFRTARYLELSGTTGEDTLFLEDFLAEEFAYPFLAVGGFSASGNAHRTDEIWSVGWHTARMCAQETYVDCPYYEQLQYVGDTRIQALISLYVSGDDRLLRKAISLFDQSRISEGLTQSRYPSGVPQVIPPYSLLWVEMVGDFARHRRDTAFLRECVPGIQAVLEWYHARLLPNGLVGPSPYWNFVDWAEEWPWDPGERIGGVPDLEGGSTILSYQYFGALLAATRVFSALGERELVRKYDDRLGIGEKIVRHCWQPEKGLFSDTPRGKSFSQHANVLAVLHNYWHFSTQADSIVAGDSLMVRVLGDTSLIQVSEYFRFYLVQALHNVRLGHLYVDQLKVWRGYLDQGFTTFPEKPGTTRSDCHAWSASPVYDLPATLAGIRPGSNGFATVSVAPAVTDFAYATSVAHPDGLIRMTATPSGRATTYTISLPPGVTGTFEWYRKQHPLREGDNRLTVTRR